MRKFAIILALTAFSGAAWGQAGEVWFNFGESLFQNSGLGTDLAFSGTSNDIKLDDSYRFGFRFNFNVGDHYGAEVGYAFNHTYLDFNPAAAAAIGVGTVSYTHLDVYKRQGLRTGKASRSLRANRKWHRAPLVL